MRKPTKEVVIENIKTLMKINSDTTYSLAERSGLAQSTVVNILSGRHKISVEAADQIAAAYKLEGWHLLMRNLNSDLIASPRLGQLYERYLAASGEGRAYIDAVAERESKYKTPLK
jgi:transcriptional regulator with XRE-family HTH domain